MVEQTLSATEFEVGSSGYLQERRYLWTARAFAVFFAVSICANIVLFLAVFNIVPLVRVDPYLFHLQDRSEQVINIDTVADKLKANDALIESMVRNYILIRNAVVSDEAEMHSRWGVEGPIKWWSSDAVYSEFASRIWDVLSSSLREGRTRSVIIYSVARLSNDYWQAEIETRDMLPNSAAPTISKWTVQMKVGFKRNMRVKRSQRLKNPLGFVVQQYSIKSND